jgi:type II secretory pathway component PulF
MAASETMHEAERLSGALRRSGTLPVEYTHIVETGELTGDVPRALADISRATDADFRGRDAGAAVGTGIIFFVGLSILTVILVGILYRVFYGGIISSFTE